MKNAFRASIAVVTLAMLTGLAYPLAVTGVAQLMAPHAADGSLITVDGGIVGSERIGQRWTGDEWFHGRPSVVAYDASTSSGSNLGPTSSELADQIGQRIEQVLALEGPYHEDLTASDIPADLVTASGSGLDPYISPAAARLQAPRVAAVRGLSARRVERLIEAHTLGRTLGVFGEPAVNVLTLNLALDTMSRG